ncbi:nuclear transport factor 2 family protein [Planotetraspora sp. GP83]|uniref:nuclear transport factor 2 family protein n=1 Tax=Planotetraspora sp. GP83 TaxID=3156264 RepID=UPI00351494E6
MLKPSQPAEWARSFFAAVDSDDIDAIAAAVSDDVLLVAANSEPIKGKEALIASARSAAQRPINMRHEINDVWQAGGDEDVIVTAMTVRYSRQPDGASVSVPCCVTFKFHDGLVHDYRIYIDYSPVAALMA